MSFSYNNILLVRLMIQTLGPSPPTPFQFHVSISEILSCELKAYSDWFQEICSHCASLLFLLQMPDETFCIHLTLFFLYYLCLVSGDFKTKEIALCMCFY